MALTVNPADLMYASRLMLLGMGAVFLVIAIMVIVVNIMKNIIGEQAPSHKKAHQKNYDDAETTTHKHEDEQVVSQTLADVSEEVISADNQPHSVQQTVPVEVITAAVSMYLTIEHEARSQSNV